MIAHAKVAKFECRYWSDGKHAREGSRSSAQPDHGVPAGNVFQNQGGILDEPADALRLVDCGEGVAREREKEYRKQQAHAGLTSNFKGKDATSAVRTNSMN